MRHADAGGMWPVAHGARRVLFSVAACSLACSGAPDGFESDRFHVVEQDGAVVATTRGGALYAGDVFTVEPVLTLQQDPQRPESLLFNPVHFTVGPDGNYYVIDRGNARVAVFDASGVYVRAFGRSGQGPGEFDGRIALQSIVGDELSIWQFQGQRSSRFRTDGTYLESIGLDTGGRLLALDRAPTGELIAMRSNLSPGDDPGLSSWRLEVLDPEGVATLAEVSTGSVRTNVAQQVDMGAGMATLSTSIPFTGSPSVQHVPGRGILATDGDRPEILWYDLRGTLVKKVVIELPARPLTDATVADWEARRERSRAGATITTESGTRSVTLVEPPYPQGVGYWSWVHVDDKGYVWLLDVLSAHTRDEIDGWAFHVVDAEGRYLGTADLPASRPRIRDGRLMAVVEDEESGEMVPTVYAIRPGDDGLAYPGAYRPSPAGR